MVQVLISLNIHKSVECKGHFACNTFEGKTVAFTFATVKGMVAKVNAIVGTSFPFC